MMSEFVVHDHVTVESDVPIVYELPSELSCTSSAASFRSTQPLSVETQISNEVNRLSQAVAIERHQPDQQPIQAAAVVECPANSTTPSDIYDLSNGVHHNLTYLVGLTSEIRPPNATGDRSCDSSIEREATQAEDAAPATCFETGVEVHGDENSNAMRENARHIANGSLSAGPVTTDGEAKRVRRSNTAKFKDFVVQSVARTSRKQVHVKDAGATMTLGARWRLMDCLAREDYGTAEVPDEEVKVEGHEAIDDEVRLPNSVDLAVPKGGGAYSRGRGRAAEGLVRPTRDLLSGRGRGRARGRGRGRGRQLYSGDSVGPANPEQGVVGQSRGQGRAARGRGRGTSRGRGRPSMRGSAFNRSLSTVVNPERRKRGRPRGSGRGLALKRVGRQELYENRTTVVSRGRTGRPRGRPRSSALRGVSRDQSTSSAWTSDLRYGYGRGRPASKGYLLVDRRRPSEMEHCDYAQLDECSDDFSSGFEDEFERNSHERTLANFLFTDSDSGDSRSDAGAVSPFRRTRVKYGRRQPAIDETGIEERLERIKKILNSNRVKLRREATPQNDNTALATVDDAAAADVGEDNPSKSAEPSQKLALTNESHIQGIEAGPSEQAACEEQVKAKKPRPIFDAIMMRMKALCAPDLRVTLSTIQIPRDYDNIQFCRLDRQLKEPHLSRVIVSHNKTERTIVPLRDVLYPCGSTGSWRDVARITKRPSEMPPAKTIDLTTVSSEYAATAESQTSLAINPLVVTRTVDGDESLADSECGRGSGSVVRNREVDVADRGSELYLDELEERQLCERLLLDEWRIVNEINRNPARFRRTRSEIEREQIKAAPNGDNDQGPATERRCLSIDEGQRRTEQIQPVMALESTVKSEPTIGEIEPTIGGHEQVRRQIEQSPEDANQRKTDMLAQQENVRRQPIAESPGPQAPLAAELASKTNKRPATDQNPSDQCNIKAKRGRPAKSRRANPDRVEPPPPRPVTRNAKTASSPPTAAAATAASAATQQKTTDKIAPKAEPTRRDSRRESRPEIGDRAVPNSTIRSSLRSRKRQQQQIDDDNQSKVSLDEKLRLKAFVVAFRHDDNSGQANC